MQDRGLTPPPHTGSSASRGGHRQRPGPILRVSRELGPLQRDSTPPPRRACSMPCKSSPYGHGDQPQGPDVWPPQCYSTWAQLTQQRFHDMHYL